MRVNVHTIVRDMTPWCFSDRLQTEGFQFFQESFFGCLPSLFLSPFRYSLYFFQPCSFLFLFHIPVLSIQKVHDHRCPLVLLRSNKKELGVSLALRYSVDLSKTHPLYQFIDFSRKNFRLGFLPISSKFDALRMVSIWTRVVT